MMNYPCANIYKKLKPVPITPQKSNLQNDISSDPTEALQSAEHLMPAKPDNLPLAMINYSQTVFFGRSRSRSVTHFP